MLLLLLKPSHLKLRLYFQRYSEKQWIFYFSLFVEAQCLKITAKVSFNIASEASYISILSGQKLIKNAKKWSFGQTELPDF